MNDEIRDALALTPSSTAWERTVEITTIGGSSGLRRRIEIWFYRVDDVNYLSGMPSPTPDWFRNLEANPEFTFHLKHGVQATLKATAHPVLDRPSAGASSPASSPTSTNRQTPEASSSPRLSTTG